MIPDLLARAFADDPMMRHVIKAGEDRHRRLFALFAAAVRACDLCGGIAASDHDRRPVAAAIWLPMTHVPVPLPTMVRSGMIRLPFVNGFAAMLRLHRHEAPCEERLGRHLDASSGYLWCVGVEPSLTGRGLGRTVIEAACEQMDVRGLIRCGLKTETEANVPLYRHLGFEVVDVMVGPRSGLTSWVMTKAIESS